MELLTLSVTGTLGMILAQLPELFRPWLAQREIARMLPHAIGARHVSASQSALKKAA